MRTSGGLRSGVSLRARRGAPALVLLLSSALSLPFLQAEVPDRRTADLYLDRARSLFTAGLGLRALEMADTALQFDPDYSEAFLLRALVFLREQASTGDAIRSLERALSSSQWSKTDPDDALRLLARTLVRSGRARSAIPLLQEVASKHPENPADALLLIRAYGKAGDAEAEEAALESASVRFPRDAALSLYRIDRLQRSGAIILARDEMRRALSWNPENPDFLLRRARLEDDPARRRTYVDAYIAKGGSDAGAANLALSALPADPAPYVTFFLAHGGWTDWEASDRFLSLLCSWPQALGAAEAALRQWSGPMDLDTDRDGFYEERLAYAAGIPVRWIADADQDGDPEFMADLAGGAPRALTQRTGARETWRFLYGPYPFVQAVEDLSRGGRALYRLPPLALGIPILDGEGGGSDPSALRPFPLPPAAAQVVSAAYFLEEYADGSPLPFRKTELMEGKPVYSEEDTDGDGKPNRKIWFSRGLPVRGLRDPASDGSFPAVEEYRDGRLDRLAVDTDGDGKADYAEEFGNGQPVRRSWDYDRDGAFDARESAGRDGITVREFSTRRDGVFDLVTSFLGSELVGMRRDGKPLPVEPDPATGVLWIGGRTGAPALDGGREGFQSLGGRTYLVFRFRDRIYAEELR